LIEACTSGRKPSRKRTIVKKIIPKASALNYLFLVSGSKNSNIKTPVVTIIVIRIFLYVSLRVLSLTLEQNAPIIITINKLQDLNIITAG